MGELSKLERRERAVSSLCRARVACVGAARVGVTCEGVAGCLEAGEAEKGVEGVWGVLMARPWHFWQRPWSSVGEAVAQPACVLLPRRGW